jgi:NADH-quinone oxidoreductase subunit M
MDYPILSIVTLLPLLGIPLVALLPQKLSGAARGVSLTVMGLTFGAALYLFGAFDGEIAQFQFVEDKEWVFESIHYKLGVDGISLLMVMLTAFLTPIALLASVRSVGSRVKEFCIALLALETAMIGTFLALDLFLFYVFWELMLIPMYLIIGVWGGPRRLYATIKFVLFTMVGSVLMLVAILYIFFKTGGSSFDYHLFTSILPREGVTGALSIKEQVVLFAAFGLAFAVKVPFFPFHTWLPDAHVEAPTAGSVLLAGVLLKMGTYGFIRFAIPFFPDAASLYSAPLMGLAVVGVIYGALVAYAQQDMKKLVAYSSVSHLGLVMLGIFALTREAIAGSVLQMVNHGLTSAALFICVGFLYERRQTRMMADFGGIAKVMPFFAVAFMIVALSSIGLPGTNGFVGEFLILVGIFKEGIGSVMLPGSFFQWRTFVLLSGGLAATGIVLGAIYMLTMVRRVMFGPLDHHENSQLPDLSLREKFVILPMIVLILWIGVAPGFFLGKTQATVDHYVSSYQARVMKGRNPKTAERNKALLKELIEIQVKDQLQGGDGVVDLRKIKWKQGATTVEGSDE